MYPAVNFDIYQLMANCTSTHLFLPLSPSFKDNPRLHILSINVLVDLNSF